MKRLPVVKWRHHYLYPKFLSVILLTPKHRTPPLSFVVNWRQKSTCRKARVAPAEPSLVTPSRVLPPLIGASYHRPSPLSYGRPLALAMRYHKLACFLLYFHPHRVYNLIYIGGAQAESARAESGTANRPDSDRRRWRGYHRADEGGS